MDQETLDWVIGRLYDTVANLDEWNTVLSEVALLNQSSWGTLWLRRNGKIRVLGPTGEFAFLKETIAEHFYASE